MKKKNSKKKIYFSRKKIGLLAISIILVLIILASNLDKKDQTEEIDCSNEILCILSPLNKTYHEKNVTLSVEAKAISSWMSNSFDNGSNITECYGCNSYGRYDLNFEEGAHTIEVYAKFSNGKVLSRSVTFSIET